MGVASGKYGFVNGQKTVSNWSLTDTLNAHQIVASNTKGGNLRKPGIRDWSGSFLQRVVAPTLMPGDTFTFKGQTAPSSGVEGEAGFCYSGPAIVESLSIVWDWENAAPINTTVNFAGNGALSQGTDTFADAEDPVIPMADSATKVVVVDGGAGSGGEEDDEMCGVTQATLNITSANQTYANACTGGWLKRVAGIIDWNLSLSVQESDLSNLPFDIGDYEELKLYVDSD